MKSYLLAATDKPTVVSDSNGPEGKGAVALDAGVAELFLRTPKGDTRLTWTADEGKQPRWLPVGSYRLLGYRISNGEWMVSSSGGSQKLDITAGKTLNLKLDAGVDINIRVKKARKGLRVMMGASGHHRAGISLYLKGQRIPVAFQVIGPEDAISAEGTLEYG